MDDESWRSGKKPSCLNGLVKRRNVAQFQKVSRRKERINQTLDMLYQSVINSNKVPMTLDSGRDQCSRRARTVTPRQSAQGGNPIRIIRMGAHWQAQCLPSGLHNKGWRDHGDHRRPCSTKLAGGAAGTAVASTRAARSTKGTLCTVLRWAASASFQGPACSSHRTSAREAAPAPLGTLPS